MRLRENFEHQASSIVLFSDVPSRLIRGCQQLAEAQPRDIPALLPGLLNCIRMIWNLSKFYNTEDRLTGLLRKISNEASLLTLGGSFEGTAAHRAMLSFGNARI